MTAIPKSKALKSNLVSTLLNQLPKARNFLEFVQSPLYMSKQFARLPWSAVYDAMTHMGEICRTCFKPIDIVGDRDDYVSYANMYPGVMEHGECLPCSKLRRDILQEEKQGVRRLNIVHHNFRPALLMGIAAYHLHLLLRSGIRLDVEHNIMFCSATHEKASDCIGTFLALIAESPWFMRYHDLLDDVAAFAKMPLRNMTQSYIQYGHLNINVVSTRLSPLTLRGHTNSLVLCDNIHDLNEIEMAVRTLTVANSCLNALAKISPELYLPTPMAVYSWVDCVDAGHATT